MAEYDDDDWDVQPFQARVASQGRMLHGWLQHATDLNFYKVHFLYFVTVSFLGGIGIWGLERDHHLPFIEAYFTAVSAMTVTGLGVTDFSQFHKGTQVFTLALILMGGAVAMTTVPLIVRAAQYCWINRQQKNGWTDILKPWRSLRPPSVTYENWNEMLELWGVYSMLGIILVYYVTIHVCAIAIMAVYSYSNTPTRELMLRNDINPFFFAVFHSISAFNNAGFSLFADSLISINTDRVLILTHSVLIALGSTFYPVALRFTVWCFYRKTNNYDKRSILRHVMEYPRLFCTHLFDSASTRWLAFVWVFFTMTQWIYYYAAAAVDNTGLYQQYTVADVGLVMWITSVSTRTAGFAAIDLTTLNSGILLMQAVLMYVSAYPVVVVMRSSAAIKVPRPAMCLDSQSRGVVSHDKDQVDGRSTDFTAGNEVPHAPVSVSAPLKLAQSESNEPQTPVSVSAPLVPLMESVPLELTDEADQRRVDGSSSAVSVVSDSSQNRLRAQGKGKTVVFSSSRPSVDSRGRGSDGRSESNIEMNQATVTSKRSVSFAPANWEARVSKVSGTGSQGSKDSRSSHDVGDGGGENGAIGNPAEVSVMDVGDEDDIEKDVITHLRHPGSHKSHFHNLLARDLTWLLGGLWLITLVDVKVVTLPYLFNLIFEVASAYGTVGISLSMPGQIVSFSGNLSVAGKLVIMVIMMMGRHRGLPHSLDTAVTPIAPPKKLPAARSKLAAYARNSMYVARQSQSDAASRGTRPSVVGPGGMDDRPSIVAMNMYTMQPSIRAYNMRARKSMTTDRLARVVTERASMMRQHGAEMPRLNRNPRPSTPTLESEDTRESRAQAMRPRYTVSYMGDPNLPPWEETWNSEHS